MLRSALGATLLIVGAAHAQVPRLATERHFLSSVLEQHTRSGESSSGPSARRGFWVQGGAGLGSPLLGGVVAATYRQDVHVVSARLIGASSDLEGSGDEVVEGGLLYGRALRTGRTHFSVAAGLGVLVYEAGDRLERTRTVGFPIEVQPWWRPIPLAGVGLYGHGNLNTLRPMFGVAATLRIGL